MVNHRWLIVALTILVLLYFTGCDSNLSEQINERMNDTRGHLFGYIQKSKEDIAVLTETDNMLLEKINQLEARIQVLETKSYDK